jgi:hypothetical protein
MLIPCGRTADQARAVMRKALKSCSTAEPQSVPAVIYQLLLLAKQGLRTQLLKARPPPTSTTMHLDVVPPHGQGPGPTPLRFASSELVVLPASAKPDAPHRVSWCPLFGPAFLPVCWLCSRTGTPAGSAVQSTYLRPPQLEGSHE